MILAVRTADDKQVYKWERVLLTSKAAPATAAGQLRWVPSPDPGPSAVAVASLVWL
jgi:hypothetical protein